MYVLRVRVDVIYVEYVLMCVPEYLSMKYVPYLIIMAFGRHSRWHICKRTQARARTHTHTDIYYYTYQHLIWMLGAPLRRLVELQLYAL